LSIRFLTFGVYRNSNIKLFKSGCYIFFVDENKVLVSDGSPINK